MLLPEEKCVASGCARIKHGGKDYCYFHFTEEKQRRLDHSHCYFIRSHDSKMVKIGMSIDVGQRMKTLQSTSPQRLILVALIDNTNNMERRLHKRLNNYREHGEWFRLEGEVEVIANIAQRHGYEGVANHLFQNC